VNNTGSATGFHHRTSSYFSTRKLTASARVIPASMCSLITASLQNGVAVNFLVEKYELVRIDRMGFSWQEQSPYIRAVDILLNHSLIAEWRVVYCQTIVLFQQTCQ
jgi:hypothetical protein